MLQYLLFLIILVLNVYKLANVASMSVEELAGLDVLEVNILQEYGEKENKDYFKCASRTQGPPRGQSHYSIPHLQGIEICSRFHYDFAAIFNT